LQVAINDIGSAEDFLAAIDETIKYFNDGDIVEGTIVKVDRDEVLLDIGYKTEGVIPSRELSIKHDVDPNEVVRSATRSRPWFSRRRTRKAG
jgi:small subunit ribosomal protein S1